METSQVRRAARNANAAVDRVLDKIERKYGRRNALPDADDWLLYELRDARQEAGYWNEIVNADRGYI